MFQTNFAKEELWNKELSIIQDVVSKIDKKQVKRTLLLNWEEHCIECAIPECYTTCLLFVKREDGTCRRFVYGIFPNKNFKGHYNFGADIRFLRWGKIEANLNHFSFPIPVLPHPVLKFYDSLPGRVKMGLTSLFNKLFKNKKTDYDEFVIECFSPQEGSFKLLLDYFVPDNINGRKTKYRHTFEIKNGYNFHTIPFEKFNLNDIEGSVFLYPEDSTIEKRLVFTWLEFVKYKKKVDSQKDLSIEVPAKKVKCVAWDLDNTLWKGILVESHHLNPRPEAIELIKKLDERGIIQTIVSKNYHEDAWDVIKKIGVEQYFLYPAINWGQKSLNLIEIANNLNIDINTFAVIDDTPFEREEIKQSLPQVRIYSEKQIQELLSLDEFDIPITETSKNRRVSYLAEVERKEIKASFSGTYVDFLISCGMTMNIFIPEEQKHILRCWELIQRSNQLNLSGNRYSKEELNHVLSDKKILSVAFRCKDKFGDYGIVGFSTVNTTSGDAILNDFVLSCRVAQKKVEHTFIKWLSEYYSKKGYEALYINLIKTTKNKPLRQVFTDLPFHKIKQENDLVLLKLNLNEKIKMRDVIELKIDS